MRSEPTINQITIEVLHAKLQALADEGANTVIRTAISPVVTDSKDCSCAIYSASGDLIIGGGMVQSHFHSGVNGVHAILKKYGESIADGDIFLVNDPHNGGGFHAQDVYIHEPIFNDGELAAWVGTSAHMMDMGGGAPGSFVPWATDCYQEALRLPPVRLYHQDVEQQDVWSILLNNVRMPSVVEMDIRSLISGTNVIRFGLQEIISEYGRETFTEACSELISLSEAEFLRRIAQLEQGTYFSIGWAEWTDEEFRVPATLTIQNGRLIFDFTDASPQSSHYYNSKAYVITSLLGVALVDVIAQDLPLNEGIFNCFEVQCRKGSILEAEPPGPIGAPHMVVGQLAIEIAMRALNLAIVASPGAASIMHLSSPPVMGGLCNHHWSGIGYDGSFAVWTNLDGAGLGSGAGCGHDGLDLTLSTAGTQAAEFPDVEVTEIWNPLRFEHRRVRPGIQGPGQYRAGHGVEAASKVVSKDPISVVILGNRERIPSAGMGGGFPGGLNRIRVKEPDGSIRDEGCHRQIPLMPGETLLVQLSSGPGWGDPIDRDPKLVEAEVSQGRITEEEASNTYGVVVGDSVATQTKRNEILTERLNRSGPPRKPTVQAEHQNVPSMGRPLYPGIEDRGGIAISARSGAVLASAPDHWTDGCPVIHNFLPSDASVDIVAYLDPATGHALAVDVVLAEDVHRSFDSQPDFWVCAHEHLKETGQADSQ